jgi:hypothetical protein
VESYFLNLEDFLIMFTFFYSELLKVLPDLEDKFVITPDLGNHYIRLRMPEDVYCDQCILQVTAANKL